MPSYYSLAVSNDDQILFVLTMHVCADQHSDVIFAVLSSHAFVHLGSKRLRWQQLEEQSLFICVADLLVRVPKDSNAVLGHPLLEGCLVNRCGLPNDAFGCVVPLLESLEPSVPLLKVFITESKA